MKNRIWIDVTSLYFWRGPAVGIIRTQQKLIQHLEEIRKDKLYFFIYQNGKFIEVQLGDINKPESQKIESKATIRPSFQLPIVPKKQALKLFAQSCISLAPSFLHTCLNRFAYFSYKFIRNGLLLKNKIKNKKDVNAQQAISKTELRNYAVRAPVIQSPFSGGDILVLSGLSWGDSGIFESLYFLKQQIDIKVISFCYDLIPVNYPHYCSSDTRALFSSYFIEFLEATDLVCCISKCTKEDLKKFIDEVGAKEVPLDVVYLGCDISEGIDTKQIFDQNKMPYILYVSTIERRKNHEVLYKAYRRLIEKGHRQDIPDLYFVGMNGWGVDDLIKDIQLDPLLQNKIKLIGRISDEELEKLYSQSYFVVFPSLYEGWGLGISEAFLHGKFVLSSSQGSLPEAGGEFAEYIDPWDVNQWAERILYYSQNQEQVKQREKNIKENWKPISWRDTAKQLDGLIRKI